MSTPPPGAAEPQREDPALAILAVATEWESRNGGLSTLNRNLCSALAAKGHRVACLVPAAAPSEVTDAELLGVELVEAAPARGKDVGPLACLHRKPTLPAGFIPDVIIGHGRVTGFAAQTLVADFYPRAARIHILHTAPSELEWYKVRATDAAQRAEGDEQAEIDLGKTAALAVGVGPRLASELQNLLSPFTLPRPVHQLNPGLDASDAQPGRRDPPPGLHCLFIGRAEDAEIKGLDIAGDAIGQLRSRGVQAVLVVRGAQPGTGQALQSDLAARVKAPNAVRVKEFSADASTVRDDLLRSSVVLMPSRSEGFGLVGLEAIANGVPALVSDQSGLAQLLRNLAPEHAKHIVVPMTGNAEVDVAEWARCVDFTLRDLPAAFERAAALRNALRGVLTWDLAANALIGAMGVQTRAERDAETIRFLIERIYELAPDLRQEITAQLNPGLATQVEQLSSRLSHVTEQLAAASSSSEATIERLTQEQAELRASLDSAQKRAAAAQTTLAMAAMRDANWLTHIRMTLMPKQPGRAPFHNDAEVALRGYHCSNLRESTPTLRQVTWSKLPTTEGGLHRGYPAGLVFRGSQFAPGVTFASRKVGEVSPPTGRPDYWFRLPNIYWGDYLEVATHEDELESPLSYRDIEFCVRNPNGKQSDWVRFSYPFDDAQALRVYREARVRGESLMAAEKFSDAVEPLRKAWVLSRHLPIPEDERREAERIWNEAIDKRSLARLRFREGARLRIVDGPHAGKSGVVAQLALRHVHAYFLTVEGHPQPIAAADNQVELDE